MLSLPAAVPSSRERLMLGEQPDRCHDSGIPSGTGLLGGSPAGGGRVGGWGVEWAHGASPGGTERKRVSASLSASLNISELLFFTDKMGKSGGTWVGALLRQWTELTDAKPLGTLPAAGAVRAANNNRKSGKVPNAVVSYPSASKAIECVLAGEL